MDLTPYMFPIEERPIYIDNAKSAVIDPQDPKTHLKNGHKAIVRSDTNEVISVVRNTYKIVTNAELIDAVLRQLAVTGLSFRIDESHSFVENKKMRLQFTFPNLRLRDRESDIALSVFVHNSYDQSEGIRFAFGAIRAICSNGMVFGEILSKYYHRHTAGFKLENLAEKINEASQHLDVIQERIHRLEHLPVTEVLAEKISDDISKRLAEQCLKDEEIGRLTQWELYNRLTNKVSHEIEPRHQARYQTAISKAFAL